MASVIAWGAEDSDFIGIGAVNVDTTAGRFSNKVACGLGVPAVQNASSTTDPLCNFWRSIGQFSTNFLWFSANIWSNAAASIDLAPQITSTFLIRFVDPNGITRIQIVPAGPPYGPSQSNIIGPWLVQKVAINGAVTTLGPVCGFTGPALSTLERLTINITYSTIGSIKIYLGGTNTGALVFTYTGDVTTDGNTLLGGYDLGQPCITSSSPSGTTVWSSVSVCDFDNRSMELFKLVINGAGALSQWTGAANGSTINEITLDDTNGIDSSTAGQVSLFTQPGSLPTGTYEIFGIGLNAYSSAAPGGTPQHLDLALRVSGTNYFSPDLAPLVSLNRVPYVWYYSPATGQIFSASEISTLQLGVKSVA